jgi:hypothetical protein
VIGCSTLVLARGAVGSAELSTAKPFVDGAQLVVEEHADPGRIQRQLLADEVGVGEGLLLGSVAVLVEQVVAGQAVGDPDQDHAGEQCDEREEQRDRVRKRRVRRRATGSVLQVEGIDDRPTCRAVRR